MFLSLIKRAVKAALHTALEEFALESGLPRTVVEEMRAQRMALAAQADANAARTDARAAMALDVEDEEMMPPTVLLMPSAARITTTPIQDDCPSPAACQDACPSPGDETLLLQWVHRQRERETGWADISQQAASAGHTLSEDALRMRHRRWLEKNTPPSDDKPPAS